ncbi:MAG: hypothetical protein GX985_04490 [Gallicola sp.]|uniref:hypothetical protein n=1 Tax=Gallicola sp. Sow4_E12 TaxID=3438785 RepID=UPI001799F681|nr:hypothetical protein [Gallicola sp.]
MYEDCCAVLPHYYENGGNGSLIYRTDGSRKTDRRKVATVMDHLYDLDLISLDRQMNLLRTYFGKKKFLPYVFNRKIIFIAMKTRDPIGKNDGAYGYIRIDQIKELREDQLVLKCGMELPVKESLEVINRRIMDGKVAGLIVEQRHFVFKSPLST